MPGLLAWAIGIPIFAFYRLNKNINYLHKIKDYATGKMFDELKMQFKVKLGFLTAGYKDEYFYWEIVLLMRKTVIVFIIVFLSNVSNGIQSLASILVLIFFFTIHWIYQPYYDARLNQMETSSLLVIMLCIYSGLFF